MPETPPRPPVVARLQALVAAVAAALLWLPAPAWAQAGVDPGRLTQELQGLGMTDLIERLGSDSVGDPATAAAAAYAVAQTAFETNAPDKEAVLEKSLTTLRAAIKANPDDYSAPIWRTDLARLLIDLRLRQGSGQSADLFADFGLTTQQQERVLAEAAPEAVKTPSSPPTGSSP